MWSGVQIMKLVWYIRYTFTMTGGGGNGSSETTTPIYQATCRHIPQHGKLNLQRHEELSSYIPVFTITL